MRLIDLDSEYIQETLYRRSFKTRQDIEEWLNSATIIDAVPVVRCEDCDKRGTIFCPMVHETLGGGLVDYASDDGYCNWAPRKE